jgi:hypothetical protein
MCDEGLMPLRHAVAPLVGTGRHLIRRSSALRSCRSMALGSCDGAAHLASIPGARSNALAQSATRPTTLTYFFLY